MDRDVAVFLQVMLSLVLTGTVGYTAFILVNALGRKLGHRVQPELTPEEVDALRGQAAETDELRIRLAELEERVDFAERLLARQAELDRLPASEEPR